MSRLRAPCSAAIASAPSACANSAAISLECSSRVSSGLGSSSTLEKSSTMRHVPSSMGASQSCSTLAKGDGRIDSSRVSRMQRAHLSRSVATSGSLSPSAQSGRPGSCDAGAAHV